MYARGGNLLGTQGQSPERRLDGPYSSHVLHLSVRRTLCPTQYVPFTCGSHASANPPLSQEYARHSVTVIFDGRVADHMTGT
ncbi:hypothetical protein Back2_04560 [Nocardioides baekrokdamisoli]|uniref:Uncharacterized protein n=1 Tax=Nocardioides baekrokdamisoli TaxID=1804624 RepID=A0A3G9IZP2_9ACTN|nr:hypothetical protein Back2_04560 [Nocardioides baekrokdamisoli]